MAWDHLSINRPHLVYIILGGFTSLFMLCSSFIKERMYIGEATVATLCGIIFGPHAANLIDPGTWGNTDQITLEFSRIVLVVQCFAVGVELPKYYMEKHWRSVTFLLIPVMTFGWLVTSLFVWWMVPPLDWLQSLTVAACVTATDPVLASSVVGKGKFAKRVPKHLRDLLSAESGCNDGMAFPFIYLALYIIEYKREPNKVALNWICVTILYECIFGAIYGFTIGYIGRRGIRYAEKQELVDRESFLVFYFVLALFCAGSGSILGVDDLLVGFAAGVGFSNDGWFTQKTEESHVSNVIDLLLNLAYFVYFGTIIPWEQYNPANLGLSPWRLVVIAIFVILFRRIPVMLALKPVIPDIHTWREALFAGHFGPIGVGAIFVAILARADLETGGVTPLSELPGPEEPEYDLIRLVWPVVSFLVIASIIVHGSSIAVFTLGKHINTLTLTMSYTKANEEGASWMNRLPRIASQSKSMSKMSENDVDGDLPPGTLPPIGAPGTFLRRQKEEDNPSRNGSRSNSLVSKRRRKTKWDQHGAGGPISQSAIAPVRHTASGTTSTTLTPETSESPADADDEKYEAELGEVQDDPEMHEIMHHNDDEERNDQHKSDAERHPDEYERYQEGDEIITENEDGEVINVRRASETEDREAEHEQEDKEMEEDQKIEEAHKYKALRKKLGTWRVKDENLGTMKAGEEAAGKLKAPVQKGGAALAYQFGNTIIVEDEDGEVVKKYDLPSHNGEKKGGEREGTPARQGIARMGTWTGRKKEGEPVNDGAVRRGLNRMGTWTGKKDDKATAPGSAEPPKKGKKQSDDDDRIRFTIDGAGQRMTKEDFLKQVRTLDPKTRADVVTASNAPEEMKELARKDASAKSEGSSRLLEAKMPQIGSSKRMAEAVGAAMAKQKGAKLNDEDSGIDELPEAQETLAERSRREQVLEGVDETREQQSSRETPAERRRREAAAARGMSRPQIRAATSTDDTGETQAEKRRREAALGVGDDSGEDSDDDNTERVVPQARTRGIRFAEDPIRGRR
ncbi:MAG: hypothetical protein M1818_007278 [Claussenomyces sp. TS43310]|nr:MAG: hypothetical protein M1818_007278 [Claussenomyces sp. TS43310]